MATASQIVNQALELIDTQAFVTGTYPSFTDGTPQNVVGTAANAIYGIARDLLLCGYDPEFARVTVTLSLVVAQPAIVPWTYEYVYPTDGIRARQVRPPGSGAGSLVDPNDPLPVRANVAFDDRGGVNEKVILTNQQNALLVYTSNAISETYWDGAFVEAMTRRLGNPLAMALAGRPDFARELLQEAEQYASLAAENMEL